ncbi:MAG TPA: 2-amino-4-hydroxy-6-hydroxymethyldihydropteridine diphosphokinase, partial [Actinotalea sp.]
TETVVPDARAGRPVTDRIRLTGISATGHHGVFEHERRDGQTFVADVVLHVDTRPAAAGDRLDLTTDYGVLAEQVVGVLEGEPADLIETVAERIAAAALTHAGVVAVDVVLHKPQAPVTVPFTDVSVEIHRSLEDPPVVGAPPVTVAWPAAPPLDAAAGEQHGRRVRDAPAPVADLAGALGALAGGVPAAGTPAVEQDRFDRAPSEPVDVVLALGSNVGASHETLRRVVHELAALPGLEVTAIAPLARTGSVGGPEQPDYLNTVVLGRTVLSPRALLHACQEVETRYGRVREERWGPRTIDIDIVAYGSTVAVADDLELPHPRAHERAFVLEPWAQVAPDAFLPGLGGGPVAALAGTAPDRGGIRWMALDWWAGPESGAS